MRLTVAHSYSSHLYPHLGRSSIVPSGTSFHRPAAQILPPSATQPIFAASQRLDYELELGFVYGGPSTPLGTRLSPAAARERIFGAVLLNDWSARDVQSWEYVPLGPFLSKVRRQAGKCYTSDG